MGDLVADVYAAEGFAHGDYVDVLRDAARRAAEADLLVAVDPGGRVVGTLTFAPGGTRWADVAAPDEAEFRMLAVPPAARGRGVAERLV
ncbi:MAG: GNAT family N-acetyltransferase, partial [Chloroflexota bacterium]|nr:GNAT family N-acetyltransferase [Chloroflexota bacterium]